MIDPTFENINRLFILSLKNSNNHLRLYSGKIYVPLVEIKDINVLIDNKSFFDQSVKNKQDDYQKPVGVSRNNDYMTGNL